MASMMETTDLLLSEQQQLQPQDQVREHILSFNISGRYNILHDSQEGTELLLEAGLRRKNIRLAAGCSAYPAAIVKLEIGNVDRIKDNQLAFVSSWSMNEASLPCLSTAKAPSPSPTPTPFQTLSHPSLIIKPSNLEYQHISSLKLVLHNLLALLHKTPICLH